MTKASNGGSTANGRLVYWIEQSPGAVNLFIRPLGSSGQPILSPVFIDKIFSHTAYLSRIESADATSRLSGSKRFLVYGKDPARVKGSLLLQKIDAMTGKKLDAPISLLKIGGIKGNIKIDPRGRFIRVFVRLCNHSA